MGLFATLFFVGLLCWFGRCGGWFVFDLFWVCVCLVFVLVWLIGYFMFHVVDAVITCVWVWFV